MKPDTPDPLPSLVRAAQRAIEAYVANDAVPNEQRAQDLEAAIDELGYAVIAAKKHMGHPDVKEEG